MKVVHIIARLNVGGPAGQVTIINQGLQAAGHQTLIIHGAIDAGEGSLEHLPGESGVRTLRLRHLGRRISPLGDVRAFAQLVAAVFRESPDVVHTHTAKAGVLGRLAAFVFNATRRGPRRCLVVHTYHGHVMEAYFTPGVSRLIGMGERALAAITDRIVTLSPLQRRDIDERLAIGYQDKTVVVPLGLELDNLLELDSSSPSLRSRLHIAHDEVVVGYLGRMVAIKDLRTLVRAFAMAVETNPRLSLVLAGDGPLRPDLEALVGELGVSHHVHFLGWIADLRTFYATIDICALSSLNEGTPVAVIEAMAAGKPVVATAVGGVPDLVSHGATGLLVPPRSVHALAEALLRLANDAVERRRMGERGRLEAERYSRPRLVTEIEQLYVSGLAEKRT